MVIKAIQNTTGTVTSCCNALLDVILSDKGEAQRSLQSLTLLQNIKAVTNSTAAAGVSETCLVHCGHLL